MHLRRSAQTIAANLRETIASNGASIESVAAAADMQPEELEHALSGDASPAFEDLVAVGGFLHVHPSHFYEGVTE